MFDIIGSADMAYKPGAFVFDLQNTGYTPIYIPGGLWCVTASSLSSSQSIPINETTNPRGSGPSQVMEPYQVLSRTG